MAYLGSWFKVQAHSHQTIFETDTILEGQAKMESLAKVRAKVRWTLWYDTTCTFEGGFRLPAVEGISSRLLEDLSYTRGFWRLSRKSTGLANELDSETEMTGRCSGLL